MKIKFIFTLSAVLTVLSFNSCAFLNRQGQALALSRQRFTVNTSAPFVEAGEIEAQFNKPFPMTGISKNDIKITYYPFDDAVCLQYRINTVTYNQFWHRRGRDEFLTALKKYNEDFTSQKLVNKNTKSKTQYGTVEDFYLIWQSHRFSERTRGNMKMHFGYYFRENSPYFAITQMEALHQDRVQDREKDEYSPEIPIFFTRAQAEKLAEIFDQEYLQSIIPEAYRQSLERNANRRTNDDPDFDTF